MEDDSSDGGDYLQTACAQSAVTVLRCSFCEQGFGHRTAYNSHLKNHFTRKEIPSTEDSLHQVPIPGSITRIEDRLDDAHQESTRQSTPENVHVCSISEDLEEDSSSYSHSDIDRDLLSNSFSQTTKRYHCHHCCKSYTRRQILKRHLFLDHGLESYRITFEKPHQCDQCPRNFQNNQRLEKHKRAIHSVGSASTFCCDVCLTMFSRKGDLTKHRIAAHEGLKPSQSVSFDPAVADKVHSGETVKDEVVSQRPQFQCDKCSRVYLSKRGLVHHQKHAHPSDRSPHRPTSNDKVVSQRSQFQCDKCSRVYLSKASLISHRKHVHPPDSADHTGAI